MRLAGLLAGIGLAATATHAGEAAPDALPRLAQQSASAPGTAEGHKGARSEGRSQAYPGFDLRKMDRDGDGKVSKQEYTAYFDKLDKNKDGVLDLEEMREATLAGQTAPVSTSD